MSKQTKYRCREEIGKVSQIRKLKDKPHRKWLIWASEDSKGEYWQFIADMKSDELLNVVIDPPAPLPAHHITEMIAELHKRLQKLDK